MSTEDELPWQMLIYTSTRGDEICDHVRSHRWALLVYTLPSPHMLESERAWEPSICRIDVQTFVSYFDFESSVPRVDIVSDESFETSYWLLQCLIRLEAFAQLLKLISVIAVILSQFRGL